jgi:hypothetical protein
MEDRDIAIPCTLSLRESFVGFIDNELTKKDIINKNISTRSGYIQYLVEREITFKWSDFIFDLIQKTSVSILMIFMMIGFYLAIKDLLFLGFAIGFIVLWAILFYIQIRRHRSKYNVNTN